MTAASRTGQATVDWLMTLALVAVLAVMGHSLMFEPLRSVFRWVADCVTLDRCGSLAGL